MWRSHDLNHLTLNQPDWSLPIAIDGWADIGVVCDAVVRGDVFWRRVVSGRFLHRRNAPAHGQSPSHRHSGFGVGAVFIDASGRRGPGSDLVPADHSNG